MESNVCLCPLSSWDLTLPTLLQRSTVLPPSSDKKQKKKRQNKIFLPIKQNLHNSDRKNIFLRL